MEQQEKFEAAVQKIADEQVTWSDVMIAFRRSVAVEEWYEVRSLAARLIEADHEAMGCEDCGISSSDINHTVYGYALPLYRNGLRGRPLVAATANLMGEMLS
jgi:hypothetical protein